MISSSTYNQLVRGNVTVGGQLANFSAPAEKREPNYKVCYEDAGLGQSICATKDEFIATVEKDGMQGISKVRRAPPSDPVAMKREQTQWGIGIAAGAGTVMFVFGLGTAFVPPIAIPCMVGSGASIGVGISLAFKFVVGKSIGEAIYDMVHPDEVI